MILSLSVLCLSTIQVLGVTICTDPNLCKQGNYSDDIIRCVDDVSCYGSSLTATDSITCLGRSSCERSEGIIAQNDITCSGYESCYKPNGNITSINGTVYCTDGYACSLGVNAPRVSHLFSLCKQRVTSIYNKHYKQKGEINSQWKKCCMFW